MTARNRHQANKEGISLTEEEASNLAEKIKSQLQMGIIPSKDSYSIELIIAGLGDRRGLIRRTFVEALGKIGNQAVPGLRDALLNHPDVTVRRASAKALKLTGDPSALPDLLQAVINDEDPVVQGSAIGAMAIYGEDAVKHLLKVLADPNNTALQCGLATWALSFIGAEAPNALRAAAQSTNVAIKAAAISALGDQIQALGDEIAKDLVVNALDDPAIEIRAAATSVLGKLNDPIWAQPHLINKLRDKDSCIRKNAALSLMKLNSKDSISELKKTFRVEKDKEVINILKLAISNLE